MKVLAVLTVFCGPGKHLALLLLVLQNTVPRGSLDGFGGFGGCGGFGRDAYPLNSTPLFRHPEHKDNDRRCT